MKDMKEVNEAWLIEEILDSAYCRHKKTFFNPRANILEYYCSKHTDDEILLTKPKEEYLCTKENCPLKVKGGE